jgi:hypothetical protein
MRLPCQVFMATQQLGLVCQRPPASTRRPAWWNAYFTIRRDCVLLSAYNKASGEGLPSIVSCLAANPDRQGMLAAGSYSGSTLLLDERGGGALCMLEGGHAGGVTHVRALPFRSVSCSCCMWPQLCMHHGSLYLRLAWTAGTRNKLCKHGRCWGAGARLTPGPLLQLCFSADGNFLYTGARRDSAIQCWDVRYASGGQMLPQWMPQPAGRQAPARHTLHCKLCSLRSCFQCQLQVDSLTYVPPHRRCCVHHAAPGGRHQPAHVL